MIDITGADAYFSTRTLNRQWLDFAPAQRKTAIEQAKRDLSRALGRALKENESAYQYGDQTRDVFAAYEQALFTLLRDTHPQGTASDIPALEPDSQRAPKQTLSRGAEKWSEEALAWLGCSSRVEIKLG